MSVDSLEIPPPPDAVPVPRTIDLLAAWEACPVGVQRELGMAAIAIGAARLVTMIEEHELPSWETAAQARCSNYFDAGDLEGTNRAAVLVEACVLGGDIGRLRPPDLAALGIRQCASCGCTDQVACAEGCHWIGPLRCSSCPEVA